LLEASKGFGSIQGESGLPELVRKELPTLGLNKKFEEFPFEVFVRGCEGGEKCVT